MASIELYINKQLCDIENPNNFSVYLKRQLINPSELSTKDAQRSYDITLPASPTNNSIFGHTNTEEVKGKFAQLYDAMLYVDSIKIFEGKFRMSEITKTYYKGNLGIPAAKTVKDIFGEKKMNEAGNWHIPFKGQTSMTEYNREDTPPCFFPLTLYGLLPKDPIKGEVYTDKNILDSTVNLRRDNFPPSINCLQMLERIFDEKGLKLSGSAYNDERLKRLYVSYRNPSEYEMMWNYGKLGNMEIVGYWGSCLKEHKYPPTPVSYTIEQKYKYIEDKAAYAVNLLNGTNSSVGIQKDTGNNIVKSGSNYTITIPYSGLYKIKLYAKIELGPLISNHVFNESNPRVISPFSTHDYLNFKHFETLKNKRFEIKVLRDNHNSSTFDLENLTFDNVFYKNNIDQDNDDKYPKYFPKPGEVNFIDQAQNENMLCGLAFGSKNPIDDDNLYCNPIAISGGESWDKKDIKDPIPTATYSPGYIEQCKDDRFVSERQTTIFKVDLSNASNSCSIWDNYDNAGDGHISQIVWLEKGEKIALVAYSDEGYFYKYKQGWPGGGLLGEKERTDSGWLAHSINFDLSIEAFKDSKDWLKMNSDGSSSAPMNYEDKSTLLKEDIDLVRFMPSEVKINDWIDNFCKVFNLDLIQTGADSFELNTKRQNTLSTSMVIDMDKKTNVDKDRRNTSLGLPSAYEIGFTIDKNEQGYIETEYDGGGLLETDSPDGKRINQTSNFSYNWLKEIKVDLPECAEQSVSLPVISDKEAWARGNDYHEMKGKNYMNKAQRFWYKSDRKLSKIKIDGEHEIEVAMVSNMLSHTTGKIRLDYQKDESGEIASILDTYFTLLTDVDNNYTTVECYLTPEEYIDIANSYIQLNNDLYYVAEIDGYDPLCKKKATIKLIRK